MQSIGEVSSSLTSAVESLTGVDIPVDGSEGAKMICFNDASGRVCEEIPNNDEIKCDSKGLCSVYISNAAYSDEMQSLAGELGLRVFAKSDKTGAKTVTGVVQKKDVGRLRKTLGTKVRPKNAPSLRAVAIGDIKPPKVCKLNPLSPSCEPYITKRDWYYMGPIAGWIRAKSFKEAFLSAIGKSNFNGVGLSGESAKESTETINRVLTTI